MRSIVALTLAVIAAPAAAQDKEGAVALQTVKYDGLKDVVLKHRGKVVYVDFWFNECGPCVKGFPHLVAMQHKWKDQGLVVVTVNFNAYGKDDNAARAREILKENKVAALNLVLDEPDTVLAKLRIENFPSVYLFDRQGRWTMFDGSGKNQPLDKKIIESTVEKLLGEK